MSYISNKSIVAKTFLSYSFALAILLAVASLSSGCANGLQIDTSGKKFEDYVAKPASGDTAGGGY